MKNLTQSKLITLPATGTWAALVCGALLLAQAAPAQAGWFDNLFGTGKSASSAPAAPANSKQRSWRLGDFTSIEIVPHEAGAPDNQQPAKVAPEVLMQQLARVQTTFKGEAQPLFNSSELSTLAEPLAQALERAGPGDDILLLSSARRAGTGFISAPTAVTARLFVREGRLQLIVHDARFEFYDAWRGTSIPPNFVYGTRASASNVSVTSADASTQRADWLGLPLSMPAAVGPAATVLPGAPAAPMAAQVAPAAAQVAPAAAAVAPAAVAAPVARQPLDKAGADDIERRLETIKRLRDKNLITEDEYQQKRKEILQLL